MIPQFEPIEHRTPYTEPDLKALRQRIRMQTTQRRKSWIPLGVLTTTAVAAMIALIVGVWVWHQHPKQQLPAADIEELLTTASEQTLREAAAENYDDIITNNMQL